MNSIYSTFHSTMIARRASLLAFAGICALTTGSAGASEPAASPQTIIETRQQAYKKMGAAMKTIVDQLKSDAPDSAKLSAAAAVISAGAQQVLHWFPAGSGPEAGIETDALPHIWQDRAKFDSIAHRLISASKLLTAATSGADSAAIKVQAKAVGDACSSCHRSFRAD